MDDQSVLPEDEFHKLADSTIRHLAMKLEEYSASVDMDIDIQEGNGVLTMEIGNSGKYVLNKHLPSRQIWLSSPVSGSGFLIGIGTLKHGSIVKLKPIC